MYRRSVVAVVILLYGCATLQFVRYYSGSTVFYLNMSAYLSGHERLPFQERVLPILFLKPLTDSAWVMHHLAHSQGAFTPERGPFYLLSFIALIVSAIYTQRLYNLLSESRLFAYALFPVLLFTVIWTYSIHSEANFSYPYDLPSLAFFTAGLYYIYARRFVPLLLVIVVGTFNRETTLFLIGMFVLDSATEQLNGRLNFKMVSWVRVALLGALWATIKLSLAHRFAGNDASESFLRFSDNLHQLKPRLVPALLNICGYTVPLVLLFRRALYPLRFRNYLWILPIWFGVMFCSGVIVETRIYGELCSFSAIALLLIMERTAQDAALTRRGPVGRVAP